MLDATQVTRFGLAFFCTLLLMSCGNDGESADGLEDPSEEVGLAAEHDGQIVEVRYTVSGEASYESSDGEWDAIGSQTFNAEGVLVIDPPSSGMQTTIDGDSRIRVSHEGQERAVDTRADPGCPSIVEETSASGDLDEAPLVELITFLGRLPPGMDHALPPEMKVGDWRSHKWYIFTINGLGSASTLTRVTRGDRCSEQGVENPSWRSLGITVLGRVPSVDWETLSGTVTGSVDGGAWEEGAPGMFVGVGVRESDDGFELLPVSELPFGKGTITASWTLSIVK